LKKPVFSKQDLLRWKVPAMLYWDLLTSGRYQPACHYFSKVKKSQLCFTQEMDLSAGPSVIFDLFSWPTGLGYRSQITEGPVLMPFSYT
jgi:hypothetical protein